MGRVTRIWLCFLVLFLAGAVVEAADKPGKPSVELTFRYNHKAKRLVLKKQRIVDVAAPRHRKPAPQPGELVLQQEDMDGESLGQMVVVDPTLLRAEWPAELDGEAEPGLLTGTKVRLDEGDIVVVVPLEERLDRVKLWRPKFRKNGKIDHLEDVGSSPIDKAQLHGFLKKHKRNKKKED